MKYTVVESGNASLGQGGCQLIRDGVTDVYTGPFVAITVLTEATIDLSACDMSFCTGMESGDDVIDTLSL